MVETTCIKCGIKFKCKKNELERGQHKYCSRECYLEAIKLPTQICPNCGNKFQPDKNHNIHCSMKCSRKGHGKWVKENQSGDNNPFSGKKHSLETRRHLSKVKKRLFKLGILVPALKGKGNPDKYKRSLDLEWRLIREKVLERDLYTCQWCGSQKRMEVHHIIPYRISKAHKETNLISLCRKCHKKTYNKEFDFVGLFRGILLEKYANGGNPEVGNPVP